MGRRTESLFLRYRERGDARALGTVFDRTADELLRVALHFARDPRDAEDWLQQTWLIAIERAQTWDATRPLVPWLLGILRNLVRQTQSRRREARLGTRDDPANASPDPLEGIEWTTAVAEAVERLRDPYRAVLVLRLQHGLEPVEIARLQRVPPATIRSQLHRGLEQLRARMPRDRQPQALAALSVPLGLAAVRAHVLAAATPTTVAATATAVAATSLTGGLVMQKTIWIAVAATALLVAVIDPLNLWHDATAPDVPPTPAPLVTDDVPGGDDEHAPALAIPAETADTQRDPGVGPDVDLNKVDRERDLHGVIVLASGEPVPGAEIVLERAPWQFLMTMSRRSDTFVEIGATRSGPRGTFAIRLARGASGRLTVTAPGHAMRRIASVVAGERVRIVLDKAVRLQVLVRDPDGQPAAGVNVRVWAGRVPYEATSNAEGTAWFEGLEPESQLVVDAEVQHEDWGNPGILQRLTLPAEGTQEYVIDLPRGRTLRGTVTDAGTGAPIANARVGIGHYQRPHTTTDAEGAYVLHGWSGRNVREIAATAPGYVRGKLPVLRKDEVLDFALVKGTGMRGRIVDAKGAPVPGALIAAVGTIHVDGVQRMSMADAVTDDGGRFALDGLAPDLPHSLNIRTKDKGRRMVDFDAVPEGVRDVGDIKLPPPLQLTGVVLHSDGTPAARRVVKVKGVNADRAEGRASKRPAHTSFYGTYEEVTTDDLGRFTFANLCAARYEVSCRAPNGPPAEATVDLSPAWTDVTLQYAGTRTLRVRVLDPDGRPVPGGAVIAVYQRKHFRADLDPRGEGDLEMPGSVKKVRYHPDGKNDFVDPGWIDVRPGAKELVIRHQRAGVIRGVVLRPDGEPLERAIVQGEIQGGPERRQTTTDQDGRFALKCQPDEVVKIIVSGHAMVGHLRKHFPYYGEKKDVRAGTTGLRIQMKLLTGQDSLRFRILGPDGKPLPKIYVFLYPTLPGNASRQTDEDGRVTFKGLSSHERLARIFGRTPDGKHLTGRKVRATPGDPEIVVEMKLPLLVKGRVYGPDGEPAGGVMVNAYGPDNDVLAGGFSTADGVFGLFLPVDTTTFRVVAAKDAAGLHLEQTFDAMPAGEMELRLKKRE